MKKGCFLIFFLTKSGLGPELGGLGGQAGCQKIEDNPPYHPKKNRGQKGPPVPEIFSVDLIPLLSEKHVDVIPRQKGNSDDTQKGNSIDTEYLRNGWTFLTPVFLGW